MTKHIGVLYFSPTNTSKKICRALALGMGADDPRMLNMTLPDIRAKIIADPDSVTAGIDHLIVGAPVHSGKLPLPVMECLKAVKGKGKECSALVVYGNRDYGVALHSLVETLSVQGFAVISAGAFIGQHPYSDLVPVAMGRPDESDLDKAHKLGGETLRAVRRLSPKDVPIQIDKFSQSEKYSGLKPAFLKKWCLQCGACAKKCPLGLISPEAGAYLNQGARKKCLGCMACVAACKNKARILKANPLVKMVMNKILKEASRERKEPLVIVT